MHTIQIDSCAKLWLLWLLRDRHKCCNWRSSPRWPANCFKLKCGELMQPQEKKLSAKSQPHHLPVELYEQKKFLINLVYCFLHLTWNWWSVPTAASIRRQGAIQETRTRWRRVEMRLITPNGMQKFFKLSCLQKGGVPQQCLWLVTCSRSVSLQKNRQKQGVGASKRPCVFAHGYISLQWCSKVSPQRERFFRDIYILWVCQKSWKGMEKWESRCDFTGFCGTKAIMLEKAAVRFFLSLFQPLLRQRSPRHLYMSSWQFLRQRKTQTHFMMSVSFK